MNNLQLINNNFEPNNLSKYQYTISLINECIRCEILPKTFSYNVQIKIGEILKSLIRKYTKGESTSVTVEKAEKLIIGIWYTIDAYMNSLDNVELALKVLKEEDMSYIYEQGKIVLENDLVYTENLYEKVLKNQIYTDLIAYKDTISGIANFFKLYDLEFEPDENAADIDYPLAFDDWNVAGVYYIKNYLWNLYVENEICSKFNNNNIEKILKSYGDIYKIDYRDLLINVFEMTINNAVFSILCNNSSLEISKKDFEKLNNNLKNINKEEVKTLISLTINKIIKDYDLEEYEINYLKRYEDNLINLTFDALKRDNLMNLIVITDKVNNNETQIIIDQENRLDDETFRQIIEEILESDSVYEKISIINNKINSIKDYIDVLKSDCIFEDEYLLLFMSLSNLELSILAKFIFYGEYRMENLDLIKTLSNKINTNYEWEELYIDYLKSLSKDRLKEIEKFINGKL